MAELGTGLLARHLKHHPASDPAASVLSDQARLLALLLKQIKHMEAAAKQDI